MGYRLAKACTFARTSAPLSPSARVMLIRMAWVALDVADKDSDAATYFGGLEWLAMQWPDAKPDTANRYAMRAMRELVAAGLVKPERVATRHRNQRYRLTVDY